MLPGAQLFQFTPLCERLQSTGYDISPKTDFNSRLSARGYQFSCHQFNIRLFQFTPLCERLPDRSIQQNDFPSISIHASLREATIPTYGGISFAFLFQFTPLCERLLCGCSVWFLHNYFNSRLSARGYYRQLNPNLGNCISIHASLREATVVPHKGPALYSISIHASLREATLSWLSFPSSFLFQFTPLCERLRATSDEASVLMNISIHASLREATFKSYAICV